MARPILSPFDGSTLPGAFGATVGLDLVAQDNQEERAGGGDTPPGPPWRLGFDREAK